MARDETSIKLTKIQREILEKLRDGSMITINRMNMAYLEQNPVQPQTRYFLTDKRLITRLDKTKAIETKGNGYIISRKGLMVLEQK
jgi:uncharacterized protein YjhX (UPF0386 family)